MYNVLYNPSYSPEWGADGILQEQTELQENKDQKVFRNSYKELQEAICDGDLAATRKFFELANKRITSVYSLLPEETDHTVRLQLLVEAALAGYRKPIVELERMANRGVAWALYGLEFLVDTGIDSAQIAFEQVSLNWIVSAQLLWRNDEYNERLDAIIEKTGSAPSDYHLILYFFPFEVRRGCEARYAEDAKCTPGTIGYLMGYLDWIFEESCKEYRVSIHTALENQLLDRIVEPMTVNKRNVLVDFVLKYASIFRWPSDSPLILQCTRWRAARSEDNNAN